MHSRKLSILLLAATMSSAAHAQLKTHTVGKLGIKVKAHKKLSAVPLKLGNDALGAALQAKFIPTAERDFIIKNNTKFDWGLHVLLFERPKAATTGKTDRGEIADKDKSKEDLEAEARLAFIERYRAKNFLDYLNDRDPSRKNRVFVSKGKAVKAKGKRPAYRYYEYYDLGSMNDSRGSGREAFWYYHFAAAYRFDDREIALVFHWPVFKKPKPDKLKSTAKRMIESLKLLGSKTVAATVKGSKAKDRFANTPERRKTLDKALENIKNIKGWDYFTSPNYICFYSWDAKKPAKKSKSLTFARTITKQMENVRELYLKYYPPKQGLSKYYPVLRICHNQELFSSYGGTSRGVVGWFNPGSKELVIFNDTEGVYGGKKGVKSVAFHEGWHQYADSYFGDGVRLHRWFDEGTGDWFGSWNKVGGKWSYKPNMGRIRGVESIVLQVKQNQHVPLRDIISWNKARFYGPRAVYYYAQGYAMVDFFRRGRRLMKKQWNRAWDNILDNYRKSMLADGDQKKAIEVAFGKIDMDALEEAWKLYVTSVISKK